MTSHVCLATCVQTYHLSYIEKLEVSLQKLTCEVTARERLPDTQPAVKVLPLIVLTSVPHFLF